MSDRPRALLLDAGGTLLTERTSRPAMYVRAARDFGFDVEEDAMAAAMTWAHRRMPRVVDGAFRYSERWFRAYIAAVFARLGYTGPLAPLEERLLADFRDPRNFRLFDEVRPVLLALHGAGVPLAVVSNWSPPLPRLLAGLSIARVFGAIVVSSLVRLEKPDPAIFLRACQALGVAPCDCLHVGDRPVEDVEGARAAGMAAVLLQRGGEPPAGADVEVWPDLRPARERLVGGR